MASHERDSFRIRTVLLAALVALAVFAAPASGYTTDPSWIATDYATGFPAASDAEGAGPLGLAFDGGGNLLVTDIASGSFYRVPPGGGSAPSSLIATGLGKPAGLAFGLGGRLYLARADQNRVDEIDPANGSVVRTVVAGLACPTGLATDPLSGDLFASNKCGGGKVSRISAPGSGSSKVSDYSGIRADGLTFAPDGTLYAASEDSRVDVIAGTNTAGPGATTTLADVSEIDGIAYVPARSDTPAYLVVNRNNGELDRLELTGYTSPIVTGASRGDLVTVGPDRCIYAALADRIIKLAPASGSCQAAPPAGPAGPGGSSGTGGPGGSLEVLGQRQAAAHVLDLRLKSRAPRKAKRRRLFVYGVTVTNTGPGTAHKIVFTEKLAKGLSFVKVIRPPGVTVKRRGRVVRCSWTQLKPGHQVKLSILVGALKRGRYVSHASVTSADLESAPGNNRAKQVTRVR